MSSPTDTSNFDVDDTDLRSADVLPPTANSVFSALHLPFLGFTYTQGSLLTDMDRLLCNGEAVAPIPASINGSEGSSNDVRRLQDEVNQLTKRNGELMQQLSRAEQQMKKELELSEGEKSAKMKDTKQWKQEKDELTRVNLLS